MSAIAPPRTAAGVLSASATRPGAVVAPGIEAALRDASAAARAASAVAAGRAELSPAGPSPGAKAPRMPRPARSRSAAPGAELTPADELAAPDRPACTTSVSARAWRERGAVPGDFDDAFGAAATTCSLPALSTPALPGAAGPAGLPSPSVGAAPRWAAVAAASADDDARESDVGAGDVLPGAPAADDRDASRAAAPTSPPAVSPARPGCFGGDVTLRAAAFAGEVAAGPSRCEPPGDGTPGRCGSAPDGPALSCAPAAGCTAAGLATTT
jgi:hypothetical protein